MFIAYHPSWKIGPRLIESAERVTYTTMGHPLSEYVVVKFAGERQVLADLDSIPDKEFTLVQKYLEEL